MSRTKVDVATILVSTNLDQVPSCLKFSIQGNNFKVKLIEIVAKLFLANEDDDGGSFYSSDSEEVAEICLDSDSIQKSYDSGNDNDDLISKIKE